MEEEKEKQVNNQNLDGWRRINKHIEIDGPPEYAFDDQGFVEDEGTNRVETKPEKERLKRTPELNVLETGFTTSKKAAPISKIDTGTPAKFSKNTIIYYPKDENQNEDLPTQPIYLTEEKEKILPPGNINEYKEVGVTIRINFYQDDWNKIYKIIKNERDTIKQFARRAMVKLAEEINQREAYRKKLFEEMTKSEVLAEIKTNITKEMVIENLIWHSKYKERDPDAIKIYPSLDEEMKKKLSEEEAERLDLAERIQKKAERDAQKKAKEERARTRALRKQPEDADKEIEIADEMVQKDLENIQNGPPPLEDSDLNKDFQFDTEGVMPEEINEEAIKE